MTDLVKRLDEHMQASAELGELTREILEASRSKRTIAAYRLEWQRFCKWAVEHDAIGYPVEPRVLGAYLVWMHGEGYSKVTINRTVTVFRLAHDQRNDPTGDVTIRRILTGIMKRDHRPIRKAKPISFAELQAICEALISSVTRRNLRDVAALSLGWIGALRGSEIVALNWADISHHEEGIELRIRQSKTNQTGEDEIVAVPLLRHEYKHVCPVRNLMSIYPPSDVDFEEGQIVPVFTTTGESYDSRMCERTIERALARGCELAGINKRFTSHSLRRGFATFAAHRGISIFALKAHGRWKSSAVAEGYIERADLWRQNPIKDLLGRGPGDK